MNTAKKVDTPRRVVYDPARNHMCPRCLVKPGFCCRREDGTVAPSSHSERNMLRTR